MQVTLAGLWKFYKAMAAPTPPLLKSARALRDNVHAGAGILNDLSRSSGDQEAPAPSLVARALDMI